MKGRLIPAFFYGLESRGSLPEKEASVTKNKIIAGNC
jgi:hypothetical protein